jgi:hypothetical protein
MPVEAAVILPPLLVLLREEDYLTHMPATNAGMAPVVILLRISADTDAEDTVHHVFRQGVEVVESGDVSEFVFHDA